MMKKNTRLINAGRDKQFTGSAVNPSLVRASTILFDSMQQKVHADRNKYKAVECYGRHGTSTSFAFQDAMCELENAAGCYVYPCGTAAITASLLSFLSAGDHLLMVDSVYLPTREFCLNTLARLGVETEFYDPMIGAGINRKIRPNTKVIYLESPGSLTMQVQDVPAIVKAVRSDNVVTMIDNTYASPFNFKPLDFGIDISIHSATKYLNGHSDVMLGVASANDKTWPQLSKNSYELGQCASVDDIYTTMRGLRTLGVRMREHQRNALEVARWLEKQPQVDYVLHPSFDSCPGHEYYQRDFDGGNGLFSMVMKSTSTEAIAALVDNMRHFKMGYSWGGFESLLLPADGSVGRRSVVPFSHPELLIRLHIGLEDTEDLIDDLADGLMRYQQHC